jgi:CubicO group peptidase (beta-lactamase class C family)
VDEQSMSRLNRIGSVRLLSLLGSSLAAVCVLAAVVAGCTYPSATGPRDGIASGSSSAEPSAPSAPRFVAGGPDTEDYGASQAYPIGDRSTYFQIPFLVGSHSHLDQIFDGRVIRRAPAPSRLARVNSEPALRYEFGGETRTLDDYLARNPATGLLVARGDTILIERYQYGRNDRHRFTSWSMAKTVTAMLVGIAIAEGYIRSVDDPAAAYVPALRGTEYGGTSLRHLLQMSSGVRFVEQYTGRDDVSRLVAETFRQAGAGGVGAVTPFNERVRPSGTMFSYASVETQVLGLVLRSAVGRPVADYMQEKIWAPIGAEADATWLIDRSGQEVTFAVSTRSCATTRGSACCSLTTGIGAAGRSFPPRGSRTPRMWLRTKHICGRASRRDSLGMAIRSGFSPASDGCSRSSAYAARRSSSIRPVGSS